MILVDTSVWVSHFKCSHTVLSELLVQDIVACHPLIVAEIACGTPPTPRNKTLADLATLNQCNIATHEEVLELIERHALFGKGCGFVDIALLSSALLTANTKLWTLDKRLALLAGQLGVSFES